MRRTNRIHAALIRHHFRSSPFPLSDELRDDYVCDCEACCDNENQQDREVFDKPERHLEDSLQRVFVQTSAALDHYQIEIENHCTSES
jgi:hypothetical protein